MTRSVVFPLLLTLLPAAAQAAEGFVAHGNEPYQLVRTLRQVQDSIVAGSDKAHLFQRQFVEKVGHSILMADPDMWKDRRNVRAAIVYALSGGDPRMLREAMTKFVLSETDDQIWRGAIAYAEGRTGEAVQLLLGINALQADPTIGGHLALVQAILMVRRDAEKAITLLDHARLLAPGTIIEEAALRRQTTLLAAAGQLDAFETRSLQYLRKYGRSLYAPGFLQSFVRVLVTTPVYTTDKSRVERLKAKLDDLPDLVKRDAFMAIAEEAIVRGRVELTRMAARRAAELVADGSVASLRIRVYEAAALIVTDEHERGAAMLAGIDKSRLESSDVSLLEAALAMAAQVRRMPVAGDAPPISASPAQERAKRAISRVDEYLPGQVRAKEQ
jgi:chemotaxis protein MotC